MPSVINLIVAPGSNSSLKRILYPGDLADFGAHFFGNTLSNRSRGNTPRLRVTDQPLLPSSDHHRNFRKLSGFAGAGFTGNNHDLVIFNRLGDFVSAFG